MTQWRLMGIASIVLAAALSVPSWGSDSAHPEKATANPARPGSLNYVEGQASIEGQSLGPEAIGKTELHPGQSLETKAGKAELLLTPGIFFRLGDNSSATMISPNLTATELRLDKGKATVEVAELQPENNVVIAEDGAKVRLTKTGFYDFDADHDIVRVYHGEANVEMNGQDIKVEKPYLIGDDEAVPIIFDLLEHEGLCLGGSSGINIAGAVRLAKDLGPGKTIVTVLCDYGTRYQSKLFDPAFLREKGLPVPAWLTRKSTVKPPYV